jgi:hypothetical protein
MPWTANTAIGAGPQQVMDVLTRPCSIAAWAPVPFEVEGLKSDRLETGSRARVAGKLAGKELEFDVQVHRVSEDELRLTASGPFVDLDVAYDVRTLDEWAQVSATIDVKGKGVLGRFVAKAVEGLLAGGALDHALNRLTQTVETGSDTAEFELHTPTLAIAA